MDRVIAGRAVGPVRSEVRPGRTRAAEPVGRS